MLSPPRVAPFNSGIRMHTPTLTPAHPDRLYVGWIDGGLVILDIADKAHPKLVMHRSWQSLGNGFAHTLVAIPSRNLMIQSEEATAANCKDWPKRDWVWDISDETNPVPLAVFPPPADFAALCKAGGRFGAHNIDMNRPITTSRTLTRTVVGSFFNGGIRPIRSRTLTIRWRSAIWSKPRRRGTPRTRSRSTMSMSMRMA